MTWDDVEQHGNTWKTKTTGIRCAQAARLFRSGGSDIDTATRESLRDDAISMGLTNRTSTDYAQVAWMAICQLSGNARDARWRNKRVEVAAIEPVSDHIGEALALLARCPQLRPYLLPGLMMAIEGKTPSDTVADEA